MPEIAEQETATASGNYAALSERVSGLTEHVDSLRKEVSDIRTAMPSAAAVRDIAAKLEALSTRLEERNKTQWPTLISGGGFLLAIMVAIGTLAYRPIEATQGRHEAAISSLQNQYIADLKEQIKILERK